MKVSVSTVPRGEQGERELPEGARAQDLVRRMGLPIAAVLVLRSGRPIPIDEHLEDGDELKVVYVASGG
jgi:sulfur carrier protein ThiS